MSRQLIRASIIGMLLWFAVVAFVFSLVPPQASLIWMLLGMVLAVVGNFGFMAFMLRRNLARLEACNWRRFCWCEYDTTSIGDSGVCPECGRDFSASLLKADFQGLMDQLGWWMPKRWRTVATTSSADDESPAIGHAPLRGPVNGANDFIVRTKRVSVPIGFIGSFVGFFGSGAVARLLDVKPPTFFVGLALAFACALFTSALMQMPYLLYRRARLARRDWNICPWCERDTRDIGTHGICPSCGGEFSAADLKADFDALCRYSACMFWLRPDDSAHGSGKSPHQ